VIPPTVGRGAEGRCFPYDSLFGRRNRNGIGGDEREETRYTASAKHSSGPRVSSGLQPSWQDVNDQGTVDGLNYPSEGEESASETYQEPARHVPAFIEKSMT